MPNIKVPPAPALGIDSSFIILPRAYAAYQVGHVAEQYCLVPERVHYPLPGYQGIEGRELTKVQILIQEGEKGLLTFAEE